MFTRKQAWLLIGACAVTGLAHAEKFERRLVQIGISDYAYAEVQKGLADGETVALELPPDVKPSQTVGLASKTIKSTPGMGSGSGPAAATKPGAKKAVM